MLVWKIIPLLVVLASGLGKRLYALKSDDLFISNDDGLNWQPRSPDKPDCSFLRCMSVAETKVYVAGRNDNGVPCLMVSENDGTSWTRIDTLPKSNTLFSYSILAQGKKIYLATSQGLFISEDEGKSWLVRTTADGLSRSSLSSLAVVGQNVYLGTNGGGMCISTDGGKTWTIKSTAHGLGDAQVNSVFAAENGKILAATNLGLSISVDGGQTWVTKNQAHGLGRGDCGQIVAVFAANQRIYTTVSCGKYRVSTACNYDIGSLYISKDEQGSGWMLRDQHDGLGSGAGVSVYVLGNGIYLSGNQFDLVSLSRDVGDTWVTVTADDYKSTCAVYAEP